MGPIFGEDDHLIASLLDLANLRFGPGGAGDGINEMVQLQKKFTVFSKDHSLEDSFAVLGLGGFWNPTLKKKLYEYLVFLRKCGSETGERGDRRIITALMENLAAKRPLPVSFKVHEGSEDSRVLVSKAVPLVYMKNEYLVISVPMTPIKRRKK
jgi:hypothetical protein